MYKKKPVTFRENDIRLRLDNSIIRYKDFPYYVRSSRGSLLDLFKLSDTSEVFKTVDAYDEDIDISNFPLGYVQINNRVVYATRHPRRTARHSLTLDSITFRNLPGLEGSRINPSRTFFSEGMEEMITGDYPPIKEAFESVEKSKTTKSMAISRDVAIHKFEGRDIIEVFFKNEYVGWLDPQSMKVNVPSSSKAMVVSSYLLEYGFFWEIN